MKVRKNIEMVSRRQVPEGYHKVRKASQLANVSEVYFRKRMKDGTIQFEYFDGVQVVSQEALDKFIEERANTPKRKSPSRDPRKALVTSIRETSRAYRRIEGAFEFDEKEPLGEAHVSLEYALEALNKALDQYDREIAKETKK